jgi:hypothetical protein
MQKSVLKECRTLRKPTVEAHVPFTAVVKDFVCPHLEVRFVSARMGTGQVHKADVVSICFFTQHASVIRFIRFEVFMVVTMKYAIFWVVMPYGSCEN